MYSPHTSLKLWLVRCSEAVLHRVNDNHTEPHTHQPLCCCWKDVTSQSWRGGEGGIKCFAIKTKVLFSVERNDTVCEWWLLYYYCMSGSFNLNNWIWPQWCTDAVFTLNTHYDKVLHSLFDQQLSQLFTGTTALLFIWWSVLKERLYSYLLCVLKGLLCEPYVQVFWSHVSLQQGGTKTNVWFILNCFMQCLSGGKCGVS